MLKICEIYNYFTEYLTQHKKLLKKCTNFKDYWLTVKVYMTAV